MLRFLQNYPHALEVMYNAFERALLPFKRLLAPGSRLEPAVTWIEKAGKETVFDCRMCGQCILHATGMTCSMTCPKNLRNGPCGGVRSDGNCEVYPEKPCIWVQAYDRSLEMPQYGHELIAIQPPVNHRLEGTSSWINMLYGIDERLPQGWVNATEIDVIPAESRYDSRKIWKLNSKQAAG